MFIMLDYLIKISKKNNAVFELAQQLALPGEHAANVVAGARPFVISVLATLTKRPFMIVSANDERAKEMAEDINNFSEAFFLPRAGESESPETRSLRLQALSATRRNSIITLGAVTLKDKFPLPSKLAKPFGIKTSQQLKMNTLAKKLVDLGYEREYQVEMPGDFSIRGNICDIFPVFAKNPLRLDFFGDELDSMRYFDHLDQRSIKTVSSYKVMPCSVDGSDVGLFDYLNPDTLFVFEDYSLLHSTLKDEEIAIPKDYSSLDLTTLTKKSRLNMLDFEELPFKAGEFENIAKFLKEKQEHGYLVVLNIKEDGKRARLKEMIDSWHLVNEEMRPNLALIQPLVLLTAEQSNSSFVSPNQKIAFVSDKDIFVRQLAQLPKNLRSGNLRISNFEDLKEGDFVVHINHGIARYEGLTSRTIDGITRDYISLVYAANDKLFVPVTEMDRISRYVGASDKEPKVSRLDSKQWALTKKRVKRSVRKLAIDLLKLYAERSKNKGFSFSKDTPWQKQLEDDFEFQETKGQMSAITQVKQDMIAEKPMDRLICGDVGYGKTEVALRAAFKAVQDGQQVLFLVPTTILAQQHFSNFKARLQPYPILIEMLSRFKTKREQEKIVSAFNRGAVDILIGTHRLIQKDVVPKSLGLIVVDEEQRFGVTHKEKLKVLKANVDVLTLTATPIPRTLQMALSGIRDLSVIETPPNNRQPVITHVGPYNTDMGIEAIKNEIARDGQVFYLYNQVRTIDSMANKLKQLVPEAKIAVAHGQLKERQLERTMLDFLNKRYNVLVTSTIIESGIDVPSANTLIVDKAEDFGLAQLYQIRGRVGRSAKQAYAYLFYRKRLTDKALKRLSTLAEHTSLGSGYRIALRDLEIRGGGNLLGPEQSGHIAAVGFDLYTHLLQNTLDELKGAKPKPKPRETDLPLSAFIPKSYIKEEAIRIDFYQRLASAENKESFQEVIDEMSDRFGLIPKEIENLRSIGLLKFEKTG